MAKHSSARSVATDRPAGRSDVCLDIWGGLTSIDPRVDALAQELRYERLAFELGGSCGQGEVEATATPKAAVDSLSESEEGSSDDSD